MIKIVQKIFKSKQESADHKEILREDNDYSAWVPNQGSTSGSYESPDLNHFDTNNANTESIVDDKISFKEEDNLVKGDEDISDKSDLESEIVRAVSLVYDPEIPVNIYELGLIYSINITSKKDIHVLMTLTAPGCPVAGEMPSWVSAAIESNVKNIGAVTVEVVWDPPWTPDMMSEAAQLELGYL